MKTKTAEGQEKVKTKSLSIAIFGADGQLGMDLQKSLSRHRVKPLTYQDVDILERPRVGEVLSSIKPDWVINAAALTNVDWCESNDVKAFQVNALGARYVAESSPPGNTRIIQLSTDYVFDGAKKAPYTEDDVPRPLNAYGITKLAGEHYVRSAHPGHYIVRTSGLYGTHPCWGKRRNFVDTMLALAREKGEVRVVCDETLTPTFAEDLAEQIRRLIESEPPAGIYHATNAGECSWYEFAETIFELSGTQVRLEKTTAREWNAPARRPGYSVLQNAALQHAGIDVMPDWRDALARYLSKKAAAS
jgi:dTDP-4-dehydrorhamnose reductase